MWTSSFSFGNYPTSAKSSDSKLADWDDDEPSALPETSSRFEKIVILKHMFTLQELEVGAPCLPLQAKLE